MKKEMDKKEKMAWYLQRDFELMFVLTVIGIILALIYKASLYYLCLRFVRLALLAYAIYSAKNKISFAPILGIVLGALMILSSDIVSLFIMIHSIVFLATRK